VVRDESVVDDGRMNPARRRAEMFLDPIDDPRLGGPSLVDERGTLVEYLRCQRLTLELKCSGLDAEQLARRAVEPSTLSLLGLIRHMAEVERTWFRRRLAGQHAPAHFCSATQPDADFDGARPDPQVVDLAWQLWREEIRFADRFIGAAETLDVAADVPGHGPISLREVLVHMVEEYARHNGHADLLRERIDGRVGA
jgi:uncharacterized damage-inducible protein DinB